MPLKYLCQRCGNCCKWPGIIRVNEQDIDNISEYLGMTADAFIDKHTEVTPDRKGLTIISRPDHSCSFLEKDGCAINPVKPVQCVGFPNEWNFPGWEKKCEAIPVEEADYIRLAKERDSGFDLSLHHPDFDK